MTKIKVNMPVGGDEPTYVPDAVSGEGGEGGEGKAPIVDNSDTPDAEAARVAAEAAEEARVAAEADKGGTDTPAPIPVEGLDQVEVDGVLHYVSAEGSVVNDKGEQVYTKAEFDAMSVSSSDIDIELISRHSGIELKDTEGNIIQFPNTVEGIAKREAYIQEQSYKKAQKETLQSFFNQYPVIKDVFDHYSQEGSISNYKPAVDYSKITLDKENIGQLEQMIIEAEVTAGKTPEMAKKLADFYTANNELYEGAVSAKAYLAKQQESDRSAKEQAAIDKQNRAREKYIEIVGYDIDKDGKEIVLNKEGSIYDKIMTKGQIGAFKIPETGVPIQQDDGTIKVFKKRDILNYITLAANEQGQSQAEIDEIKHYSNLDNRLLRFLHNLTQGDMSKLVPQAAATAEAKRIKRVSATGIRAGQNSNTNTKRSNMQLKTPV